MIRASLRFLSREVRGMHQAAYLLAAFALASQFTGLIRDRILAATFGAGHTLDIYYAAFLVPNFLFATIASLFSLYALLPVLSRLEEEKGGLMISFLQDSLIVFSVGMAVVSMIAYILAPVLAHLVAPGLAAGATGAQLVELMRILLLQPLLLGLSNTIASLTQLRHRFILYSISPLLYNMGIIFGALVLYPLWGIAGLGWGVVFGSIMHVGVQLPFFFSEPRGARLNITKLLSGVKEVLVLSIPRTLALASTQISVLALTAMASLLTAGSIAVFNFANNLQSVPLTIIGVSYAVAVFPTLSRLHAKGEKVEFLKQVEAALRHVIFWATPATIFMIVMRAQLVRLILGAGQFNWTDTRLTAAALALFVTSLAAQSLTLVIARAYYAIGNTRKPFYYGCADVTVSILSALGLLWLFHANLFARDFIEALFRVDDLPGTSVLMLALGYALGSSTEFLISYYFFLRDFAVSGKELLRLTFESFSASVIGAAASYAILLSTGVAGTINTTAGLLAQSALAGGVGLVVAAFVLWALNNPEFAEALSVLRKRFRDTPPVALEPSDAS